MPRRNKDIPSPPSQVLLEGPGSSARIGEILQQGRRYLVVRGGSFDLLPLKDTLGKLPCAMVHFRGFSPNPRWEEVLEGIRTFRNENCDGVLAVGGGSAIDVAKCIKLFAASNETPILPSSPKEDNGIPLLAVPTTAGSGSESTPNAVVYLDGEKQSVYHGSMLPGAIILDPLLLSTLPLYQKKATLLDALAQAIESYWTECATPESMLLSETAIRLLLENMDPYLQDPGSSSWEEAATGIIRGSNFAGRAIAVTRTTAPHAMSYKLTTLYGLAHGHSVALSLPEVWELMTENVQRAKSPGALSRKLHDLSSFLGVETPREGAAFLRELNTRLGMARPHSSDRTRDLETLTGSVNLERLSNSPIVPTREEIRSIYDKILDQR